MTIPVPPLVPEGPLAAALADAAALREQLADVTESQTYWRKSSEDWSRQMAEARNQLRTAEALALTNGEARGRAEAERDKWVERTQDADRTLRERLREADRQFAMQTEAMRRQIDHLVGLLGDKAALAPMPPIYMNKHAADVVNAFKAQSAAEAERDELRGLLERSCAAVTMDAALKGMAAARAWLRAHPAIPEGTPGEGKGRL